ncbi:unnamed protein product [Strongylus vulgaris]|uniref:Uncharacterized protein n=1 Tax=Strongylus vulgaris TaxID=40348 RepID=A0A3P7JVI2_STRVU|nr:unnamed protein product [Strongylus vulgaris]
MAVMIFLEEERTDIRVILCDNSPGLLAFFCCDVRSSDIAAILSLPVNGVTPKRPDEFFLASIADDSTAAFATKKLNLIRKDVVCGSLVNYFTVKDIWKSENEVFEFIHVFS